MTAAQWSIRNLSISNSLLSLRHNHSLSLSLSLSLSNTFSLSLAFHLYSISSQFKMGQLLKNSFSNFFCSTTLMYEIRQMMIMIAPRPTDWTWWRDLDSVNSQEIILYGPIATACIDFNIFLAQKLDNFEEAQNEFSSGHIFHHLHWIGTFSTWASNDTYSCATAKCVLQYWP